MKAIFTGSLSEGFGIFGVVDDDDAGGVVAALTKNGLLAEALIVQSPAVLDKAYTQEESGLNFVVFTQGLGSGIEVFGPFTDYDCAHEFGDRNQEDDDWELFVASAGLVLARVAETTTA
jgi:hypothetical protein